MTVAGVWSNEYGSRMSLLVENGKIAGTYDSTTGSTGSYLVVGREAAQEPAAQAGQPVALAICWRSVVDGPPDASWHWTSSLGGQVSLVGGEELLVLHHLMHASGAFPGVCERGTYVDKLTYRRIIDGKAAPDISSARIEAQADPLSGRWQTPDGIDLELTVRRSAHGHVGMVDGTLELGGRRWEVIGVTDILASADQLDLQSVALAAIAPGAETALALGGAGRKNRCPADSVASQPEHGVRKQLHADQPRAFRLQAHARRSTRYRGRIAMTLHARRPRSIIRR